MGSRSRPGDGPAPASAPETLGPGDPGPRQILGVTVGAWRPALSPAFPASPAPRGPDPRWV